MNEEIGVDVVVEDEEYSVDAKSDVLKGEKGEKGDPTATIEINKVITGEAGTEASIENVGTDVNLKLEITIPRGDVGKQGEKGDTPVKGTDYFTESEIEEIKQDILADVSSFDLLVVNELPTENIQEKTIYLVPKEETDIENNVYSEYIYVNDTWEMIGSTEIDTNNLTVNLIEKSYEVTLINEVEYGGIITVPAIYKVGLDRLDVYLNGEKLIKADTNDIEGHYYEVGMEGKTSNQIQLTSDWRGEVGDVFEFIIRTNGEGKAEEIDTLPVGSIIEYAGDTVPDGYVEVEEGEVYSSEEVRIGTWIDGKPLYRKVFIGTLTTNSEGYYQKYLTNEGNIDRLIQSYGNIYTSTGCILIGMTETLNSNGYEYGARISTYENNIGFDFGKNLIGRNYEIIVKYTKTTD